MPKDVPRVSIIILNWKGWKDTIECLESLYRITYPNYDVIVVDNGSKDDSVQKIKEYAEGEIEVNSKFFRYNPNNKPIKIFEVSEDEARQGTFNRPLYEKFDVDRRLILIKNKDNCGFAGGNNIGIKFALSVLNPDYVLLINNDTVVDPNFLTELVKVAESDERIGVVGPKIYYYDYKGRSDVISFAGQDIILPFAIQKKYERRHIDKGRLVVDRIVDSIEGSCMLLRREILGCVKLLSELFFAYWEEVDLCYKVRRVGYKVICSTSSKIWHKESGSFNYTMSPQKVYLITRNKVLFLKRNTRSAYLVVYILYFIIVEFWILALFYVIVSKNVKSLISFVRGFFDGVIKDYRDYL